ICWTRAASSRRRRSTSMCSSATPTCSGAAASSTMDTRRAKRNPKKTREPTMTRIRSLASAALFAGLAAVAPLHAQEPAPDQLVKTVTLEVVDLIAKDREIRSGNRAKLIELIDAKVLPDCNFC